MILIWFGCKPTALNCLGRKLIGNIIKEDNVFLIGDISKPITLEFLNSYYLIPKEKILHAPDHLDNQDFIERVKRFLFLGLIDFTDQPLKSPGYQINGYVKRALFDRRNKVEKIAVSNNYFDYFMAKADVWNQYDLVLITSEYRIDLLPKKLKPGLNIVTVGHPSFEVSCSPVNLRGRNIIIFFEPKTNNSLRSKIQTKAWLVRFKYFDQYLLFWDRFLSFFGWSYLPIHFIEFCKYLNLYFPGKYEVILKVREKNKSNWGDACDRLGVTIFDDSDLDTHLKFQEKLSRCIFGVGFSSFSVCKLVANSAFAASVDFEISVEDKPRVLKKRAAFRSFWETFKSLQPGTPLNWDPIVTVVKPRELTSLFISRMAAQYSIDDRNTYLKKFFKSIDDEAMQNVLKVTVNDQSSH